MIVHCTVHVQALSGSVGVGSGFAAAPGFFGGQYFKRFCDSSFGVESIGSPAYTDSISLNFCLVDSWCNGADNQLGSFDSNRVFEGHKDGLLRFFATLYSINFVSSPSWTWSIQMLGAVSRTLTPSIPPMAYLSLRASSSQSSN